ncbi:MAG: tRNA (N(6)-L-threonylcarbamoyladenosine(37)-C(2))-methylthiotransferase MtaB [Clostridia bacterium]|nr:tRNA (N(6)-L-threonylcarbamoyladenosine(37)-C(2))-methylthiotransferase MtaB [Clostridia bacterium]
MKKVAFYTLGCRVNQYETNAFAEEFMRQGWQVCDFEDECDLYVINTCAVTGESARKSGQIIRRAARKGKVAVVGCYSQLEPEKVSAIPNVIRVGGNINKQAVVTGLEEAVFSFEGCGYEALSLQGKTDLFSSCRAYVKIQDGCPNRCSYCIIPTVRGPVRSRGLVDIINECKTLVSAGYSEIVLTGIEVSAYDGAPLSELVRAVSEVDGIRRLRLGSLTPTCIDRPLLEAMRDSKVFCPHLHLSVQSGCTRILNLMRRKYNKEQLQQRIDLIREILPDTMLSADIITGFPTETEEEAKETLEFCVRNGFMHVHSFPYSPRPGTEAAAMKGQVDKSIRNRRNEALISATDGVREGLLDMRIGTKQEILTEKSVSGVCVGHTKDFIECTFEGDSKAGEYVLVNIISHQKGVLKGERV